MSVLFKPFKFKPNRVKRLYRGGSGIDHLRGMAGGEDGNYPEDWIASCIEGNTREYVAPGHGVSTALIDGDEIPFPTLLATDPVAILGEAHVKKYGASPGVLTKLLDSAVLLPLQVHPDNVMARSLFHSDFGKTEAWIVLSIREIKGEKPYLLLGFNESLDPDIFRRESLTGEFHRTLDMLHKFEVEPGDVFVVYGRMPHAIGPGITMVEVMEPTDYVIIPEKNCFGVELSREKRFAGLVPERAMDIFDYRVSTREEILRRCCPRPEPIKETSGGILHRIISRDKEKFFEAQRLTLYGQWNFASGADSFLIGIVTAGSAELINSDITMQLMPGDSFFIPASSGETYLTGDGEFILILPPEV
ncbi:MAG: hypothetical protein JXR78_12920 [Victivallales bacterium]|nr:hypothetical protein [Victivallales bacterium]